MVVPIFPKGYQRFDMSSIVPEAGINGREKK